MEVSKYPSLTHLFTFVVLYTTRNFGPLADLVKDGSRSFHQQNQQQIHGMQSQLQPQHQNPIRLPQQVLIPSTVSVVIDNIIILILVYPGIVYGYFWDCIHLFWDRTVPQIAIVSL